MTTQKLIAFHGDKKIKEKYLNRVLKHQKNDRIIKGVYWEHGKGCAVGCTIEGANHERYEIELGIPVWLAHLEDTIFENLPNGEAMKFPALFLKSIIIGYNLEMIKPKFLYWLLNELIEKKNYEKYPEIDAAIQRIIILLKKECQGEKVNIKEWNNARSAAESAAESAAWNARSAAWNARSAAESPAWSPAWSAAESAAWNAGSAAWSASSAESARSARSAWSASSAAESAWSAAESARSAAESPAWSPAWEKIAEKLIKLLKEEREMKK